VGYVTMVHIFAFFWLKLPDPGRQPNEPLFWLKFYLETRLSSDSSELLIGFLAYLHNTAVARGVRRKFS